MGEPTIDQIEQKYPLALEHEADARYAWPARWEALCTVFDKQADEIERLLIMSDAVDELLEVAALRGDDQLLHPADDAKLWTARMQDAWTELGTAAKQARNRETK